MLDVALGLEAGSVRGFLADPPDDPPSPAPAARTPSAASPLRFLSTDDVVSAAVANPVGKALRGLSGLVL